MATTQTRLWPMLHGPVLAAYPTPRSFPYAARMTFSLAPHAYALLLAEGIYDRVLCRDGLYLRPEFVTKAVLGRLRTGIRALEAFLRRILILMAFEMEHDLVYVNHPENMARSKPLPPRVKAYSLMVYPLYRGGGEPAFFDQDTRAATPKPDHDRDTAIWGKPKVPIGNWLRRLDYLGALAQNPLKKAKTLAYKLARYRHGIKIAPYEHHRLVWRLGTEVSATHDAMAHQIVTQSRLRPPPHPPPKRGPKPSITIIW